MPAAFGVRLTNTRALLSVTRGRRFLIQLDQPGLVISAIRSVVKKARRR
jgi:hypothetical protein